MQRLRDTFRRRQNTLEAQAKAEATKIQQQQVANVASSSSTSCRHQSSNSRSPSHTGTCAANQSHASRSPTNSTTQTLDTDMIWMGEPSPPLSPAHRNETSLSFGSTSNATNEDIEEEDEDIDEEGDDFDLNMSALTLNDQSLLFRQQQQQYLSDFCAAAAAAAAAAENGGNISSSKKMCLEVPNSEGSDMIGKQMRSASFDEVRSRELMMMSAAAAGGSPYKGVGGGGAGGNALNVPDARNIRSRSFDYAATGKSSTNSANAAAAASAASAIASKSSSTTSTAESRKQQYRGNRTDSNASGGLLDVPKWKLFIRRPSSTSSQSSLNSISEPATEYILFKDCVHCSLMAELGLRNEPMLTPPPSDSFDSECSSYNEDDEKTVLEQMDASEGTITAAPSTSELNKLPLITTSEESTAVKPPIVAVDEFLIDEFIEPIEGLPIVTFCPPPADSPSREVDEDSGSGITVISLEVPVLAAGSKQARSASVDSPYLLQVPKRTDIEVREGPPKARSKSVDIVLPTTAGGPYLIVPPLRQPPITTKKTIQGEIKIQAENGETRVLRSAPDWTESAINGDHLWVSSNTSGSDLCYVGERECLKTGPRLCCPVCKVIAHTGCISILIDKMKIHCKPTFKDGVRQYREQQIVKHHWVHRRHEKGRCKACGKSFQSKLTFGGNKQEVVAVSCSWCKASYHNKAQCINESTLTEACDFGNYAQIIVPPTWIVKLPRKGSFKSSIRRAPRNKRLSSKRRSKNKAADASSSSSCSSMVTSAATAAAVMSTASSSPNVLLVSGGGAGGGQSSLEVTNRLSLNNGTSFNSSANNTGSSNGGSSTTIASSLLSSTSSGSASGSSPSPSSVILGLQQESGGGGSDTPSPFFSGTHNGGGNNSSGGGSSTTSPGGPSPSPPPPPLPPPAISAHLFQQRPDSAHSHYYSKHNNATMGGQNEMSGIPAHLYGAMVPSPMGVGGGSRRQYRRHSHAAVSASSLTSSGLLTAEGKDGGGGSGMSYAHSTSHYLQTVHRSFTIKPIPSPNLKPLLVFINPKSGGNQGAKLMQKFQWHLNPRQVFDLSQGGPRLGLDLYKKVHNLRVLACGGDGTAGWVLSTIDEIGIVPPPPIAVLPLGTGNDLARSINWGASYTDEPVSKILCNIQDGEVVQLDRWNLKVQRNPHAPAAHSSGEEAKGAKPDLPLNVVNNYFSIGVDAHIALSFHEAREAHPERFNSRFKNRIFYGQAGSKDLMQRKWKDLSNYVKLVCDGVDYTSRLKELKVHSVLFLNIPSYSGGTRPWAPSSSYDPQSTNDGQIEVIGLTTYQLPLLQAGGHGTPIAQCQSARITTTRTIPMQVDGEPCKLLPSIIVLELRNKANLIAKTKSIALHRQMPTLEKITLKVRKLNLVDYETYHYDKERLRDLSTLLGTITIEQNLELIHVRTRINDLMKEKGFSVVGTPEVCTVASSLGVASLGGGGTGSNTASPSKTATSLSSGNLTTIPSTSLNSPPYVSSSSASSVSSKFVSNDWCFVDSCTAERFFRIDRAQEHLHYVVDICNEDLYILDPQFDESKDETIDILTTEEVLTEVLCSDDVTEQGSSGAGADQLSTDTTDQPSTAGNQIDAKTQLQSIDENSNLPGLPSLNNGNRTSTNVNSSSVCDANKLSLPGLSATNTTTSINNSNTSSGNVLRPGSSTSDLDSVNSLAVSPADMTISRHSFLSTTSNHNGSIGSPSPLSPQPPSSPYTSCSIDSPPRSPRRGQKALSPQSYRLQDQLMSAAQTGDVGLLKNLHHQGVNLMGVDENRMTALHHAAMNGHESAVAFLLNAFTPDVVDLADRLRGQTALHHAVMAGHRNISTMLVIRGATLSAKDHQGRSALDLAHFLGRHDLALALSHLFNANNRETTV